MKQWILKAGRGTGLESLVQEDGPVPRPGPGQVRLRVHAVSLNYRDQLILNHQYGVIITEDLVPVSDGAGEIDQLGDGVTDWQIGDRVSGLYFAGWADGSPKPNMGWGLGSPGSPGMLTEYVVLDADRIARMPKTLDYAEAATLPCAGVTAWNALNDQHPVSAGQHVLVLGTGGVALFALLLARAAGARVTATTSQDAKVPLLRALGAADIINYATTPEWGTQVFERTGGGAQKVVNSANAAAMNNAIAALAPGGEIAFMGLFSGGDAAPIWPYLMAKGGSIRGTSVGSAADYAKLSHAVDAHQIKPPICRRFPFARAKEAYRAQIAGDLFGKIVIDVVPQCGDEQ